MDLDILQFLAAPFVASLILTGIHAYLGVHVVERGVIFVDLSLAQIAALGSTIAILLPFTGGDPHGPWVYWTSLAFTFIGAAIFSTIRVRARAHPAGGDHRHRLRGGLRGHDPGDEPRHLGERAPQGHAGRQHPGRLVGRGRQDRRALRRDRRSSTTCSAASSWRSRIDHEQGRARRAQRALLGLPLLRVVRLRGDVVGARSPACCWSSAT